MELAVNFSAERDVASTDLLNVLEFEIALANVRAFR